MPEPEAPRAVPDVTLRPSGTVVRVSAGGLQAALDAAKSGDRLTCDPSLTWNGNWTIRRPAAGARVILASSRDGQPVRFITHTPQPVFATQGPAGGVHFLNAEITLAPSVDYRGGQSLVQLGTNEKDPSLVPRSFVFERCHLFGNPGQDVRRGILANCADFAFLDGTITLIHQRGSDSQAICGWSGALGHLIRDSRLEAAGENIMYGGSDSESAALAPADITVERCHLFKPLEWKGKGFTVKNNFELKHAKRVRLVGSLLENNWGDEGQSGYALVLTTRNENGRNPWAEVSDVRVEHVEIRNSRAGVNFLAKDDRAANPSQTSARITLDNVFFNNNGGWRVIQINGGPTDLVLKRVTATGSAAAAVMLTGPPTPGTVWRSVVLVGGQYGIFGDGKGNGGPALDFYLPGATFDQVYLVTGGGIGGGYSAKGIQQVPAAPIGLGCDQAALAAARVKPTGSIPVPPGPRTVEQRLDALEAWQKVVQERLP